MAMALQIARAVRRRACPLADERLLSGKQIGKADELTVHNRKWVGNQTNRGGYIW